MTTFQELGLAEPILKALAETGYETPTPIQRQAIPPVLAGQDVLGIAQTGTGKTAAFALPILNRLAADRRPTPRRGARCLVLSPTRELASQIAESFRTYGKHLGFTVTVVFGGVSERPQTQALTRGVDILVATPGRLLDHMSQKNVSLSTTEVFVLDEADQMLDLGFFRPIRKIVATLPMRRQSLFFSATMPKEIEQLTVELLRDPVKVEVAPRATTVERVTQRVIHVESNKKKALLVELLADKAMLRTLVFTRTKRGADRVAKHLVTAGIEVSAIHGNKSQNQREASLEAFRRGQIRVLVATDIAARGIDIDEVTHVVNFDLPEVPEAYVHRIGRTARAGAEGAALAFCDSEERHLLRDIERVTRQTIISEDRRNDPKLLADKASAGGDRGGARSSQGRGGQGHGGQGRGGQGRGGEGRGGDRPRQDGARQWAPGQDRNGYSARPARDGDAPRGPSRDGAPRAARPAGGERGERSERPWSNRPSGDRTSGDTTGGDRERSNGYRADDRGERSDRPWTNQPGGDRNGDRGGDRGGDRERPRSPRPHDQSRSGENGGPRNDRGASGARPPQRSSEQRQDGPRGERSPRSFDKPAGGRPQGARPAGPSQGVRRDRAGYVGGKS